MLELRSIFKAYQGEPLLRGVSLSVRSDETVCLLGPSGSGKSTILEIIAGLQAPESGQVIWDGVDLAGTPPHKRDFGFVFQDYALFPHLNVADNIAFGPRMKGWKDREVDARVEHMLDLVGLRSLARRSVVDLSGGEQQRVALARALSPRPRLLMLDEPLGALDRALRQELGEELRLLLRRARVPAIYVTHDQEEASAIADRIAILHEGRIVRDGTPRELWRHPGSPWVASFLGLGTALNGHVLPRRRLRTSAGTIALPCRHRHAIGEAVWILVRPEPSRHSPLFTGTVADAVYQAPMYRVTLENGLFFNAEEPPRKGRRTRVRLPVECLSSPKPR